MQALIGWLAATNVSLAIQNVLWIVPAVQTVHLVAVAAVLSSMLMIGLRLVGRVWSGQTVEETLDRFLPWVWFGVAVLAATGAVLIVGEPARTLGNPAFWIKMSLLAVVLLVALSLRRVTRVAGTATASLPLGGRAARVAVAFNFALWCGVAIAGRWIAYVVT